MKKYSINISCNGICDRSCVIMAKNKEMAIKQGEIEEEYWNKNGNARRIFKKVYKLESVTEIP